MSDSLEEREDFLEDDPEELYEIINGVKSVKGVPTKEHTALVGEIYGQLRNYLEDKTCQAFSLQIPLEAKDYLDKIAFNVKDYYLPDVLVVCDDSAVPVPSLVVEVASEGTVYNDLTVKLDFYRRIGVKEYWIVVNASYVLVHLLDENREYQVKGHFTTKDILTVPVTIFPDLSVVLDKSKLFKLKSFFTK
jgi:Uma2 family endonuclease